MTEYNRCIYTSYMAKTVMNVKVDEEIKEKARALADELGLPLSTIVNANLREFVRSGEVTFSREPKLRLEAWKELQKAVADYRQSRNVSPRFAAAKEAIIYLNT